MSEEYPLIKIFLSQVPTNMRMPFLKEFERRKTEIQNIWDGGYERYIALESFESTVHSLLAMALFYRYVIANLDGVSNFYAKINREQNVDIPIRIGKFMLDKKEHNKLLAVHIQFQKMMEKYQIPSQFFDFAETIEFLSNCLDLYNGPKYNADDDSL